MSYEILRVVEVASGNIDSKVKQLEEALGRGSAKDFGEYREMCGEIKGLLTARNFLADLTKNLEQLDE